MCTDEANDDVGEGDDVNDNHMIIYNDLINDT